jgi:hypothetical protein
VKHGDTYFGTPKGQTLRSTKAAERWLGLAASTPAASASAASASAATASRASRASKVAKTEPELAAAARLRERTSTALLG